MCVFEVAQTHALLLCFGNGLTLGELLSHQELLPTGVALLLLLLLLFPFASKSTMYCLCKYQVAL